MAERFILLHGTAEGPLYLASIEVPGYSHIWMPDKADARLFDDRGDADQIRKIIVLRYGLAVAVVPEAAA